MTKRPAAILAATVLLLVCGATPALADDPVQQQVDAHLAAYPGGKQTSPTEISYGDGRFVITFVQTDRTINGPDCPVSMFCFYDKVDYQFPRGKLADCGWQDLAQWGWQNRTESAYYNLNYGWVTFINHAGRSDHGTDYGIFSIGTDRLTIRDVYPYRNQADHVYRYC